MDAMSAVWVDANGGRTITLLRSTTGAGGILTALLAASQADFLQTWESAVTANGAPAPAGGTYRPVTSKAGLTFLCADNTQVVLVLPAPSLSVFLADQETLDITNALIVAIATAAIGTLVSATGSPATALLAGSLLPSAKSPL